MNRIRTTHLMVKAMGEDGNRLNIRRATLRDWRRELARHLRAQGVSANATDRAIRGETKPRKSDGIHRAAQRGVSSHWRQRTNAVAQELARGGFTPEPGKARLLETRRNEPLPRTEKESIARSLEEKSRIPADRDMTR
jgi:hypothetical protein